MSEEAEIERHPVEAAPRLPFLQEVPVLVERCAVTQELSGGELHGPFRERREEFDARRGQGPPRPQGRQTRRLVEAFRARERCRDPVMVTADRENPGQVAQDFNHVVRVGAVPDHVPQDQDPLESQGTRRRKDGLQGLQVAVQVGKHQESHQRSPAMRSATSSAVSPPASTCRAAAR